MVKLVPQDANYFSIFLFDTYTTVLYCGEEGVELYAAVVFSQKFKRGRGLKRGLKIFEI